VNPVTLCLAYYLNPAMLRLQYEFLRGLPAELKAHLAVIVVDDGSPSDPAAPPAADIGVPVQVFRITVDVPWNQDAARNLAVARAMTPWVALTDMDHVLPEETVRGLVQGRLDKGRVYRFGRRLDAPYLAPKIKHGAPHPHPNSWVMTRKTWDRIGGYDEALAGNYGTDGDFQRRARAVAPIEDLPLALIRYPREVVADASTTTLPRKRPEDKDRIRAIIGERGPGWRPLRLSFPWVRVA
jgi:hypothetical protein